jgi:Cu2+-exporting ATPase
VRHAPVRETRVQNYAEHFADRVVPWSFLAAGASALATGQVHGAAALLIIDYGSGIRVAAPTTVLASMTQAARHGILIKGGRHLEQLAAADTIVFDKTGTLTLGVPEVVEVISYGRTMTAGHVLALAAAAEERLTHPMAEAIVRAARARTLHVPERASSEYTIGLGVEAAVDGHVVLVGCHRFMTSRGVSMRAARRDLLRIEDAAASPVFVALDGELIGTLVCTDPLRPEAPAVVRALRSRGVRDIVMLTGDHPGVAKTAAAALGIDRYVADAFPEQKSEFVKELQQQGRVVAVVGDGINDSPALARADVGIAVRGGTDVARETAHVAILEGNLWKIPQAIDIARDATALIKQNWDVVFYPNTVAIGLSLAGLIGPVGATLLSNGAGIVSALNALRPLFQNERSDERHEELLNGEFRRGAEHQVPPAGAARQRRRVERLTGVAQIAPGA